MHLNPFSLQKTVVADVWLRTTFVAVIQHSCHGNIAHRQV